MKTIKLIVFGVLLLIAKSVSAQTFKPVNYSFVKDPSSSQHGTAGGSQFENSYNFNWTAANGYGVWGVNKQNQWYLMSNRLGDSFLGDSNGYTNGPLGYVAKGDFDNEFNSDTSGTCYPKVATNLLGSVRFVRLSGSGDSILIRGFDDEHLRTSPDIDIEFNGIPKPASTLSPIKAPLRVFPSIYVGAGQPSLTPVHESDSRDWFDIAMDGKFLYVTWVRHDSLNFVNPFSVWTAVTTIDSGNVVISPKMVGDSARRPTIACDVRNNSTGFASPRFDIAYIRTLNIHNNGALMHFFQNGTMALGPYPVGNTVFHNATSPLAFYSKPQHCRMLVSSTATPIIGAPVKAIYVLTDHDTTFFNTCGMLVYHKILNNTNIGGIINGKYVDGNLTNSHPQPITSPKTHELYDAPLVGFANPYDGEPTQEYNEFHCLYSLKEIQGDTNYRPILIVRGFDNGRFNNPNTITPLTRYFSNNGGTWFRTALPVDDDYSGCVNQMGIFAYWREYPKANKESVLMARDTSRSFDEPIEENTLVSHSCWVKDGRGHFGTIGAELSKKRKLTLWSDPYHRMGVTFVGTQHYLPGDYRHGDFFNANLIFKDSVHTHPVHLRIGSDTSTFGGGGALMVAMPNHLITFEDSLIDRGQRLIINPYHKLSWYGGPFISVPENYRRSTIHGAGTIQLKPNSNLVVHGGSQLIIPDYARLEANTAVINLEYEPSIIPPYNTNNPAIEDQITHLNIADHGKLVVHGSVRFDTCEISSGVGDFVRKSLIKILPSLYEYASPQLNVNQFIATYTSFAGGLLYPPPNSNLGYYNLGILVDADQNKPVRKVDVNNCYLIGSVIVGERITNDFSITNNFFYGFGGEAAILLSRPFSTDSYNQITISQNVISIDMIDGIYNENPSSAIIIKNYSLLRSSTFNKILISENEIFTNLSYYDGTDSCFGIGLFNTSAEVIGNVIDMYGLRYGIANMYTAIEDFSNSFICSNTIANCLIAGLLTQNWKGHAKLNNISGSGIGHLSTSGDIGGVTYSRYFNNVGAGLKLYSASTSIDLSGKNGGGQQTLSFDTIDHNNIFQDTTTGEIHIANSTLVLGTSSMDSITVADFAKNTFIKDTSNKYIIYNDGVSNISVGGINQNFWGEGSLLSPTAITLPPTQSQNLLRRITYLPNVLSPLCGSSPYGDSTGEECGITYTFGIKSSGQFGQSLDTQSCEDLKYLGKVFGDNEMYRQEYDTLKYAMEQCALYPRFWAQFTRIYTACAAMGGVVERLDTCREWLKKVLYYNVNDSDYYCADVNAILHTFGYFPGRGRDFLGALAVAKYIYETGRCKTFGFVKDYITDSIETMKQIEYIWRDSVQDSIKTPFNPVLPTIDDLNLGILRGPNEVVGGTHDYRLGELIAVRNPFNDILDLKYRLEKNGLVKIDVLDILGRSIYSEGQGYKPDGEHILTIQTYNWASGSYYVRLSTPSGEIKTVKLIKE